MITSLTYFADSSSGLGALGIDGKALIIQLITFVLAFLVLQKWAFKPILKIMNERHQTIENGVKLGEQMKKDEVAFEEKVAKELRAARVKADAILAEANEAARDTVREAEDKARDKAAGILKEADARIVTDTQRARKQLEGELVSLISDATETIIGEKVDAKKDAQLIERALQEQKA